MLFERKLKSAQQCIKGGFRWVSAKGTRCMAFVGIYQVSDASEILGTETDLVLAFTMYVQEGVPYLRVSCRSRTGWDVGAFARTFFGGGGHKASSGFHMPIDVDTNLNAYATLKLLVDQYEATQLKSSPGVES
jgi:nanoRNase/pAp phosphatase (c-di-AMP/oligoRNAs hydrolase)